MLMYVVIIVWFLPQKLIIAIRVTENKYNLLNIVINQRNICGQPLPLSKWFVQSTRYFYQKVYR